MWQTHSHVAVARTRRSGKNTDSIVRSYINLSWKPAIFISYNNTRHYIGWILKTDEFLWRYGVDFAAVRGGILRVSHLEVVHSLARYISSIWILQHREPYRWTGQNTAPGTSRWDIRIKTAFVSFMVAAIRGTFTLLRRTCSMLYFLPNVAFEWNFARSDSKSDRATLRCREDSMNLCHESMSHIHMSHIRVHVSHTYSPVGESRLRLIQQVCDQFLGRLPRTTWTHALGEQTEHASRHSKVLQCYYVTYLGVRFGGARSKFSISSSVTVDERIVRWRVLMRHGGNTISHVIFYHEVHVAIRNEFKFYARVFKCHSLEIARVKCKQSSLCPANSHENARARRRASRMSVSR